jgi:transposase
MGSRRIFTQDIKRKVVGLLRVKSAAEICREYEIGPNLLSRWKREYDDNPGEAFKGNGHLWKWEAKLAEKDRLIGQLYAENEILKKNIAYMEDRQAEERRKQRCNK